MDENRKGMAVTDVPISAAREVGGVIHVSGQIPAGSDGRLIGGNVENQTLQVLLNVEAVLRSIGASKKDVVKTTVYLTNVKRDFSRMNTAYESFFAAPFPARTTIGAQLTLS